MTDYRKIFLLFGVLTILVSSPASAYLNTGDPAPSLIVTTLTGEEFSLEKQKGKVTVVHFGATWCESCLDEMKVLNKFYSDYHSQGVETIALFLDQKRERGEVVKLTKTFNIPMAVSYEAKKNGFGAIGSLPLTYIVDAEGVVRDRFMNGKIVSEASLLDSFKACSSKSVGK